MPKGLAKEKQLRQTKEEERVVNHRMKEYWQREKTLKSEVNWVIVTHKRLKRYENKNQCTVEAHSNYVHLQN